MRICLVANEITPFFGSGIGVYAAEAVRAWSGAGHEVHVVTGDHAGIGERAGELFPGVAFHTLDVHDPAGGWLPEPRAAAMWPLGVYREVVRLHGLHGFEYVEFPDFGGEGYFALQGRGLMSGDAALEGAVIGVRLHTPALLVDATNLRTWRGRLRGYLTEMEEEVFRKADVVWAPSRAVVEAIRGMGAVVEDSARRPVVVSYNPFTGGLGGGGESVSMGDAAGPASAQAASLCHQEVQVASLCHQEEVVFVGRLERRKGLELLVRAGLRLCRERAGLKVRILGGDTDTGPFDGSVVEWLEGMIPAGMETRVVLEGHRPREECVRAVREATVVCFPALWDNWPYALLEAMAAGACIVASDGGGQAEMIQDGRTGVLVRAGDEGALEVGLRRVLGDEALRRRLGAGAREAARTIGEPGRFARETIGVVEKVRRGMTTEAPRHGRRQEESGVDARGGEYGSGDGREEVGFVEIGGPKEAWPESGIELVDDRDASDVTVVIPFKDMAGFLPQTLESLRRQTAKGFGVVLVDDGSERVAAVEMVERIQREGAWKAEDGGRVEVRVSRRENAGPAAARNAGIAACSTDFVVTLDSDDVLEPTHIEKCLRAMRKRGDLACVGTLVAYFDESVERPIGSWAPLGLVRDMLPGANVMGTGSGIMFRRAVLVGLRPGVEGGGPFDPSVPGYEDWELYCALAAAGHKGEILPEFLLHYRVRADSRQHGHDRKRHERLVAELMARHPGLALRPDRAMRLILSEETARRNTAGRQVGRLKRERRALRKKLKRVRARLAEARAQIVEIKARRKRKRVVELEAIEASGLPLRYRAADRAAGVVRRFGLSRAARGILRRLGKR